MSPLGTAVARQHVERLVEALGELLDTDCSESRRRQLQGKGQSVKCAAQAYDVAGVGDVEVEARARCAGAIEEKGYCLASRQLLELNGVFFRQVQGPDDNHP